MGFRISKAFLHPRTVNCKKWIATMSCAKRGTEMRG
jgi:hypothetical protein